MNDTANSNDKLTRREALKRRRIERAIDRLARDLRLDRATVAAVLGAACVLDPRPGRDAELDVLRELAQVPSPF